MTGIEEEGRRMLFGNLFEKELGSFH